MARVHKQAFQGKDEAVRIVPDSRTNSLIVFAKGRLLIAVRKLVIQLDIPTDRGKGKEKARGLDRGKGKEKARGLDTGRGEEKSAPDPLARAKEKVTMWRERVAWAVRMVKKGYLSKAQVQAEQARLKEAEEELARLQKGDEEKPREPAKK
jgi:hypothetical protein